MPKVFHSISFRIQALSFSILIFVSTVFLFIFIGNAEKTNRENLENLSESVMNYVTLSTQMALSPAMEMVYSAAALAEGKSMEELEHLFAKIISTDSSVYDLYYGTAKSRFHGGMFAGGSGWRPYEDPDSKDWDQIARPWFIEAVKANGNMIITEPYIDSDTKRYVFTIAKTAKSSGGSVIGVVAADIFLDVLNSIMQLRKITEDGVTYLVDSTGLYLTHKDIEQVLKKNIFDDFSDFVTSKAKLLKPGTHIILNDKNYMASSPIEGTSWYLVSTGSMKELDKSSIVSILFAIAVCIIIAAIVSLFFGRTITNSLKQTIKSFDAIGAGDMAHRLEIGGKSEIAKMSRHFNKFMNNLQEFMQNINRDINTLNESTHKLSGISGKLAEASELTVDKSNSVAGETEKMASSIKSIVGMVEKTNESVSKAKTAAERMNEHINAITTAIEQMDKNIEEIGTNMLDVCKVATEATEKAENATEVISKLGAAAKEIGNVTTVIKKIADKTNLLALNATIEAASAGAAGKGFAVVAGEIKELANQSAENADNIALRIESIQKNTNDAIEVIHDVSGIITKINQSVKETGGHVEQQNKASSEIVNSVGLGRDEAKKVASSIDDIVEGVGIVSGSITKIAGGADDISKHIKSVNSVTGELQDAAIEIHDSVDGFSKISMNLRKKLGLFRA